MKSMKVSGFDKNFANPVAKHDRTFNKATVQADRKNDYKRRNKHRNKSED